MFGAALTGAVAEVMVCTFILDDQITSRRATRGAEPLAPTLAIVRLQMVGVAALAGAVALADTQIVVGLVITAFRVFVPGIVPQAVLALLGRPARPGAVAASMIAGPLVSLILAEASRRRWRDTAADPVLWGTLVVRRASSPPAASCPDNVRLHRTLGRHPKRIPTHSRIVAGDDGSYTLPATPTRPLLEANPGAVQR